MVCGSDHEYAGAGGKPGQVSGDGVSVGSGDVAVEDDDVVVVYLERRVPVAGDVGRDGPESEPISNCLGEKQLVFHDQRTHRITVTSGTHRPRMNSVPENCDDHDGCGHHVDAESSTPGEVFER